ncbi:MAG: DUF4230 domain-containing protein [Bacilli bacterium]|nr:DUF4230 domain-containing protein [Bacilli bacterium]
MVKKDIETLSENVKKIELTGNLITYEAYYHNVIEYNKDAGSGLTHLMERDRKLFAEYTGTIKYGIDLAKVKIDTNGYEINVFIPKAKLIGDPNVDKDDFKEENFIESKDSWINKNSINGNDSSSAFDQAQKEMKELAEKDEETLALAQKRAKILIEENINQFCGISQKNYTINWEYEQ